MSRFMMLAGAAVFVLGTSAFAGTATLVSQGQLVEKAVCNPGSDTVSPSGPCQGNNGFGNGGNDGTPGASGAHPGGAKCGADGSKC
jgi:hypothetical protein